MSKRFIDTEFFKHPFVRGLKAASKGLYCYIICDCDGAGIWNPDFEIAEIYLGVKISKQEFEKEFSGKYVVLENGQYFFPDFIEYQYQSGLSATNPAHINFIKRLKSFNLIDENLRVIKAASKRLQSHISNSNSNSKGNSNGNGMGNSVAHENFEKLPFELFWTDYDYKKGDKTKVQKKWDALTEDDQQAILNYLPAYKATTPDKQFRKHPMTFLNNRSWKDELTITKDLKKQFKQQHDEREIDELRRKYQDTGVEPEDGQRLID